MQLTYLLVGLIGQATAWTPYCPPGDGGGDPVFLPHPTDCSLYYECSFDQPNLMSCPEPLFFDSSLNVCNWPEYVDCDGTAGTTPSKRCPDGWQEFWSHCYLYGSQSKNWNMANSDCILEGGNLASIQSKAEHDFVSNLVPSNSTTSTWVGASDMAKEVIHISFNS